MNTFLSAAQIAQQAQYLKFVEQEIAPIAQALDKGESDGKEALTRLAKEGYLGITIPKEYGGQGGTLLDLSLLVEAVSGYAAGLAAALASHSSVVELILTSGSDQQKARFLPLLATGEVVGAQAFSEEQAGSDFRAVKSEAKLDGQNAHLSGTKTWVVNGSFAGLLGVLAKEGDNLSLWLVDTKSATLKKSAPKSTFGFHSASASDLTFDAHQVTLENRVATGKQVDAIVEQVQGVAKTIIAACAVGLAGRALQKSATQANTRQQFGGPIAQFQGVQWKLADHSVETQASRLLVYRAGWSHADNPKEFRKYAAMAKSYASRTARLHSGEALQIFGMLGASCEEEMERLYRDSKLTEIFEGTSELQKVIIKEELGV